MPEDTKASIDEYIRDAIYDDYNTPIYSANRMPVEIRLAWLELLCFIFDDIEDKLIKSQESKTDAA